MSKHGPEPDLWKTSGTGGKNAVFSGATPPGRTDSPEAGAPRFAGLSVRRRIEGAPAAIPAHWRVRP